MVPERPRALDATMREATALAEKVRRKYWSEPTDPKDAAFVHAQLKKNQNRADHLKMLSDIFEAAVMECIAEMGWLGKDVEVSYSPYDDFKNGVDIVLAFKDKEGHTILSLVIDVTFGQYDAHDKFAAIKHEIDVGEFGKIKYPGLKRAQILTPQTGVLHCVVAFTKETIESFIPLWMNKDKPTQRAMIENHPIKHLLVREIFEQVRAHARHIVRKPLDQMGDKPREAYAQAAKKYGLAFDALSPLNEDAERALARPTPDIERLVNDPTAQTVILKAKTFQDIAPAAAKRVSDEPAPETYVPAPLPPVDPNQPRIKGKLTLRKEEK